ncbi:MAG: hypothetical protein QOJ03_420 [Frankiaceae bacterium]|jgi:hypothetical protein|nr:hypothetical protein [Frankiaceae bacterium]
MTSAPHASGPGPLGEEAARLAEALAEWARGHAGSIPDSLSHQVGGSAECRLCPVCQAIALMRQVKPETVTHLMEASAAMAAALRSMVESPAAAGHGARGPGVERIDLDGDAEFDVDDVSSMDAP